MKDDKKSIEEYNPEKKRKVVTVFDDTIGYMISDQNFTVVVTELFITWQEIK